MNSANSRNSVDQPIDAPTSDKSRSTSRRTDSPSERTSARYHNQSVGVLLDLSGDVKAAREWASSLLPGSEIREIDKVALKWTSRRKAVAAMRELKPSDFIVFTSDLDNQGNQRALMLLGVLAGARRVVLADSRGRSRSRSRIDVLLFETTRFVFEIVTGYAVVLPLSWLITAALRLSLFCRPVVRASRTRRRASTVNTTGEPTFDVLYIHSTLFNREGGMLTHVVGFVSGAASLGHRIRFLTSGVSLPGGICGVAIKPTSMFGATKALFELWNNLVFTGKIVRLIFTGAIPAGELDLIYQRYSRFNWTGVAISLLTGLPLLLEFNGSEVWVSGQWDPVGQLSILRRFESLNQRAADLIFVVSEVERTNLLHKGIDDSKIRVNPNGVDNERFNPDVRGKAIREVLGAAHKKVVGFVGTFGPWHGAPVLATAATRLANPLGFHFLFVGDGDQRAETERLMSSSSNSVDATFTGRIAHDRVPSYIAACDILVSPQVAPADGSEFFGSPTKLFEYMALARPVIASRLGQMADLIVHEQNGLLVEPGDPDDLAKAIEKLAEDEHLCARLGAAARQTVMSGYTWRDNAARVFNAARAFQE